MGGTCFTLKRRTNAYSNTGGVSGGQTDPLFQAFKHLSITQRPDVRRRLEEIGESDRPQRCSKCGESRRGHVCQADGSNEQVGAAAERTRRSLLAREMLSSTPAEVLARLDLELPTPSNLLEAALDPDPPMPASKSTKSALQLQLDESRKTNKENVLKMEEMQRELTSLKALNPGQLGARRNLPLPSQRVAVPVPWVHSSPSTSAAPLSGPPPAAVKKSTDALAKLGKKKKKKYK